MLRNRIGLKYRIGDITTGAASVETFNDLDAGFETLRMTIGVEREISGHDVSLFYSHESPSNDADDTVHIIGVGFELSL